MNSLLSFFYPPYCLNCLSGLDRFSKIFCSHCLEQIDFIEDTNRCPRCFLEKQGSCQSCREGQLKYLYRSAAVFDSYSPIRQLFSQLKHQPRFVQLIASYLTVYILERRNWPTPQWIVPVPSSKGDGIHSLVAGECAKLLQAKVCKDLYLPFRKRGTNEFDIRTQRSLEKGTALCIDFECSHLRFDRCAEALLPLNPGLIFGLGLMGD